MVRVSWPVFLAYMLFLLAAWTVFIKHLFLYVGSMLAVCGLGYR